MSSPLRRTIAALCLIGVGLSAYLTYEHFTGSASMLCSASATIDCVRVTSSSYSRLFDVPVALLGLVYYAVMSALCLVPRPGRRNRWARVAALACGLGMVLYLIYAEMQVGAICLWCSGVHLVTLALLVLCTVDALTSPHDD